MTLLFTDPLFLKHETGMHPEKPDRLRSITAHIGNDYKRVRIGIGHPGHKDMVQPYVLSDFAKDDRPWVEALRDIVADNAELLARGQDASFQNKVHLAMGAKGFGPPDTAPAADEED